MVGTQPTSQCEHSSAETAPKSPATTLWPGDLAAETASVVERYEKMVHGIALTHTRSREDAEDVYQEVFLTYHRKQPPCRDEEHRKAWLIKTTVVTARRVNLAPWRTRVTPIAPEHIDGRPSNQFTFGDTQQDGVFAAVRRLPPRHRTIIHLHYLIDLPIKQVAAILDIAEPTARKRLERARALLKHQLEEV
ncbi:MAG: sigma-70 family RNA polymerase sigma factor [Propionibacteriaceae bacterium]|nr:sigma-70 family RNA polymerase sigma factor [Propionibacteriaceae bacterium]